jgi:hypothetical protein
MPASKWNSNINWDDLRGQRLNYIVRSIYNATVERDYWYKVMSVNQFNPKQFVSSEFTSNSTLLNKNTFLELEIIFETFERWLRPYSIISNNPSDLDLYGFCVFYDDSVLSPDSTVSVLSQDNFGYSRIYGTGNYDYTSGGNLSALVNFDLSFIGDGYVYGELNGDHLRAFYNILNLNLKSRCFPCYWRKGRFGRPDNFLSSNPRVGLFYNRPRRFKRVSGGSDYQQIVNDFNNSPYDEQTTQGYSTVGDEYTFIGDGQDSTNILTSGYESRGVDSSEFKDFEITDFNTTLLLNIEERREANLNTNWTYTTAPTSKKVSNNNITINNIEGVYLATVSDEIDVQSIGPVNNTQGLKTIRRVFYPQLFIDLNKEGFLNYYTEPTP